MARKSNGMQVGDVLYSSWGYDQTNASFYEIVKRTPKMVTLVEVGAEQVWDDDRYNVVGVKPTRERKMEHEYHVNSVTPYGDDPDWRTHVERMDELDCFAPRLFRKKIQGGGKHGPFVKITSYANARPWDGTPKFDTIATGGMGH